MYKYEILEYELKPLREVEKTKQVLSDIERAKERTYYMYGMIDGVLEFSKISRYQIKMKYIDTEAIITYIFSNISVPEKIIREVKLPTIFSDEVSLNQIFRNLITKKPSIPMFFQ